MLNPCFHTYREIKDGAITLSKLRDLVTTRNYQKKISEENIRRKYRENLTFEVRFFIFIGLQAYIVIYLINIFIII